MAKSSRQQFGSSYSAVYNVLLKQQKVLGRNLKIVEAEKCIEGIPGLVFSPGTTFDGVLKKMEYWAMLNFDGDFVHILS